MTATPRQAPSPREEAKSVVQLANAAPEQLAALADAGYALDALESYVKSVRLALGNTCWLSEKAAILKCTVDRCNNIGQALLGCAAALEGSGGEAGGK